jgi:spermidine/putrescine transport system permease protein
MKFSGLRLYALFYLVFLYAPIALLPVFAFNDGTVVAFPLKGFTLKWFGQLFENGALGAALQNSLIVAVSTAILSTTFGIFAARSATRYNYPGKAGVMGLIMLPLVLPEIIVAVSLLVVLLGMGVQLSIFTVILGHVLIATPYAIAVLNAAFSSLDRSLEEAAYDLGETAASTFRLIILPLVMPGILSSFLICFTAPSRRRSPRRRCCRCGLCSARPAWCCPIGIAAARARCISSTGHLGARRIIAPR